MAALNSTLSRSMPPRLAGAISAAGLLLLAGALVDRVQTQAVRIRQATESQAAVALAHAGFPWARLQIDNDVGRLLGTAPNAALRDQALAKAADVLAPAIGWPGVFARLEDAQRVALAPAALPAIAPRLVPRVVPEVVPSVRPVLTAPLSPVTQAALAVPQMTWPAVGAWPRTAAQCIDALNRAQGDERVLFDSGAVQPSDASLRLLDRLAPLAQDCPGATLAVQGHTDAMGTAAQNQRLSLRRAEAVRAALVARGMSVERLSAEGLGASQPLDASDQPQSHVRNRRIEFRWFFASR